MATEVVEPQEQDTDVLVLEDSPLDADIQGLIPKETAPATEPAAPAPAVEPGKQGVVKDLVHERGRRRDAEANWKAVEAERVALEERLRVSRSPQVVTHMTEAEVEGLVRSLVDPVTLKAIRDVADKAESFGEVAEIVTRELAPRVTRAVARDYGIRVQGMSQQFSDALFSIRMETLETLARRDHDDYDQVLRESGITAGLATVQTPQGPRAVDEVLARKVFGSPRGAAEELYQLAMGKLVAEGKRQAEDEPQSETPEDAPAPAAAGPVTPKDVRTAVKQAEAAVLQKVVTNGTKPRGIRDVPAATTQGKPGIRREQIDRLADENPEGYRKLMAARPDIRQWYLGGS